MTHIVYLKRKDIDVQAWDQCIQQAPNGLLYAYSWYLDCVCPHWDALVLGHYEAVMPLPWNAKWGIRYSMQPFFAAQLGVFGAALSSKLVEKFLTCIPAQFRYLHLFLNEANNHIAFSSGQLRLRHNYLLSLHQPYEQLRAQYREQTKRNIAKADKAGIRLHASLPIDLLIQQNHQQLAPLTRLGPKDFARFERAFRETQIRGKAQCWAVLDSNERLLSGAAFLYSHQRAYYSLAANTAQGKTLGTSHWLIDAFIQEHAGSPLTLDFEGSNIPGLAFFYSSFGAQDHPYPQLILNRLPWPLCQWKR